MRAIRSGFFQMLGMLRRDMMLFVSCLTPALAGLFFRFAIPFLEAVLTDCFHLRAILSPYYQLIDLLFAMLSPTMFCFASAMIALEERDEKTAVYLFITPLGKTGYLVSRFGIPSVIAFLATLILLPVFKLTALSPMAVLLLAAGGTLQGILTALLILTVSSNKLEGMAAAKLSASAIFGAAVPFFIRSKAQYMVSVLPTFWLGKAIYESRLLFMLPALVLSAIWVFFLLKLYLRKGGFCGNH